MSMITCRELSDFMIAYLQDELPSSQRVVFERHLAACSECQAYLDSYRQTVRLLGSSSTSPALTETAPDELIRAVMAARACC